MEQPSSFSSSLAKIDIVIHLAAMNHQDCEKNPEQAQRINVDRTQDLIAAAIQAQVSRFLYMSTIHVYGTPLPALINENTIPHPKSIYAKTHFDAEQKLLQAHDTGKIQALIIRLANAMGAPAHPEIHAWGLLVNDLCRQATQNRKMTLNSSGNQERNFVSISFLTHAVQELLKQPQLIGPNPVFNVGGPQNFTIWEVAKMIQSRCSSVLGYTPELTRPLDKNDDQKSQGHFEYDIRKIESIAGTDSLLEIEREIDQTLIFCKETVS